MAITPENIMSALQNLWDNDIRPALYGSDYADDFESCYMDAATDTVENFDYDAYDIEDYENKSEMLEDIATELCGAMYGELDYRMAYGAPDEWVETHVIWNSDILDYYRDNEAECDDALNEIGDIEHSESISEIISRCVTVARMTEANTLMSEVVDDFTNSAYTDSLRDYLR